MVANCLIWIFVFAEPKNCNIVRLGASSQGGTLLTSKTYRAMRVYSGQCLTTLGCFRPRACF
jgi:hypothetical protein